jgi:squalene synthase HpnC
VVIESGHPMLGCPRGGFDTPREVAARARDENFPVASRILPKRAREQLMAIYGFARLADDIGDEAEGDRLRLLDSLEAELERAAAGEATDPVLRRLGPVISDLGLQLDPYRDLIEANRMDQRVTRYETFDDLVAYCMLSAAPVGRLVLAVFGVATPERILLSDRVCIGLQIVEHLQDIGEDAGRGRIYLPRADLGRWGCDEGDLLGSSSSRALRSVVLDEAVRARALLASGVPLARTLGWRARVAVCGFAAGGLAALDSVDRAGGDVLGIHCRPRPMAFAGRAVAAVVSASTPRSLGALRRVS